jgi:hypothetical protein
LTKGQGLCPLLEALFNSAAKVFPEIENPFDHVATTPNGLWIVDRT